MDFKEVPVGFSMALARNEKAVNAYAMMTKEEKQAILEKARSVRSKQEMDRLMDALASENDIM